MKGMETAVAVDGGLSKGTAFALAAVAEVLLVAIFGLFIQKNYFVLLYLNITITLCVALPRLLLIGTEKDEHVRLRADMPFFFPKMICYACLATTILFEPFYCDSGYGQLGGHLIFDVVLFGNSVLDVINAPNDAKPVASTKKVR
jgi:hypothetical protein